MKIILALLLLAAPAFAQDQVWTWVDEKGEEHFTNDKSTIPENFRSKAKQTEGAELSVVKTRDSRPEPTPTTAAPQTSGPTKPVKIEAISPRSEPGPIRVVVFEASTNSASKTLNRSGVLEKLVSNNPGLKAERVEFATAVERAERLKVTMVPTVLFVDDSDTVLARATGLVTLKELQQQLDKARGGAQ